MALSQYLGGSVKSKDIDDWIGKNQQEFYRLADSYSNKGLGYSGVDSARGIAGSRLQAERQAQFPEQFAEQYRREADPYSAERDQLIRNPQAALESSPFFKYMQENYVNQAKASNAARGFTQSGRGLMALGEAGQRASANYLFPYMQALGKPQSGADAYWKAFEYMNPRATGGGGGGSGRMSLGSRQSALPSGGSDMPISFQSQSLQPAGNYNPGYFNSPDYGPLGPPPGYGPSAGAGTGYVQSDYGTTQFKPQGNYYRPFEEYQ